MNILLLNYEFPPIGGGGANATLNIATELVSMGHKVDVITSKFAKLKSEEIINGFRVFRVSSWRKGIHTCGMFGAWMYVLNASRILPRKLRSTDYDIIHYFFGLPTGFISLLPGRHRKIPYIVSLRGSDVPLYDMYNKKLQIAHFLLASATKQIWKNAKRVVSVTESLKKTAQLFMPEQNIEVIPNGVNTEIFYPRKNDSDKNSVFNLITVTRLIERKGVQHIFQAIAELNCDDIRLLLVGSGEYEEVLKKMCKDLDIEDKVSFYGFCDRDKLPELYARSDVFILPSLAEAFGNVFAEAMACGLPIIGANEGGIPDLVRKDNGILVDPENIEEIKSAIISLKNDSSAREKMSEANIKKITDHYQWRNVAKKYLDIYEYV